MTDAVDIIPKPEGISKTSRINAYQTLDKQQGIQKMIRVVWQGQKKKGLPFKLQFIDLDQDNKEKLLQITEDDYAELPMSLIPGNSYLVCMIFVKGIVYDLDTAKMGLISEVTDIVKEPKLFDKGFELPSITQMDLHPKKTDTDIPSVSGDKPLASTEAINQLKKNESLNRIKERVKQKGSQSLTETTNLEEYTGEIIKSPSSLLAYLPPIEEAKAYFKYLQDFKLSVLDKTDVILIKGNLHIKRSGWEKFVNVFRLDHWIVSTKKEITKQHLITYKKIRKLGNNIKVIDKDEWLEGIQYTVIVAMKSLTGSTTQGIGLVQQYEGGREDRKEHDILTHAETRAFNRACSKIVGLGEVSAEEIN